MEELLVGMSRIIMELDQRVGGDTYGNVYLIWPENEPPQVPWYISHGFCEGYVVITK